jgi:AAA domain-containing protein
MNADDFIARINAQAAAARLNAGAAVAPAPSAAKPNGAAPPNGYSAMHLAEPELPAAGKPQPSGPPYDDVELEKTAPPDADEEPPIADRAAAKIVHDAIIAIRSATNEIARLRAISTAARQLDPITQSDAIDHLSDMAIDVFGLDPKDVQAALANGWKLRDEDRSGGARRQDGDQRADTDARDRKRGQDKPGAWRENLIDPQKLCDERFPEVKYVVPGIFPEGVTLLASRPKLGKSWLILQITTAVASGSVTLVASDHPVQGDILYLALEDTPRRLQRRLTKYFGAQRETWPARLRLATTWRRLDQGGIEDLREWCKSVDKPMLIAIDILKKVRKPKDKNQSDYDADHEACEGLMELAKEFPGLSIMVVHHDRKMDAEDVFDTVSGTLGLTGGVDTIAILKRNSKGVTLHVEGRDLVDAIEKAIRFDRDTCRWMILGEAAEVHRSDERSRVLAALADLPDGLAVSEIQVAAQLGTRGAADMLLSRMFQHGEIIRAGRGRYSLPQYMREKREKDQEHGVNPAKPHTPAHTPTSNASNAHSASDHTLASDFLRWALEPARRLVRDIEESARAEGLLGERQRIDNAKSFQLAKKALGVVVEREGFGPGSKVFWRLPDDEARRDAGSQITREPEDGQ